MNARAKTYCAIVIGTALAALPLYDWASVLRISQQDVLGAAALVFLALMSEVLVISASVGGQQATSSIAFLPLFACVLLFPPPVAIGCAILTFVPSQLLIQKRPPLRAAFNASQMTLSLMIAAALYAALPGPAVTDKHSELLTVGGFSAFAVFGLTFFFVNHVFVSVALALIGGSRLGAVFSRLVSPTGVNLLYDVLVSPIAAVVALLYSYFWVPGLAIVILPLLIIRHSYASNQKLAQANKDLLTVLVKTIETRDPYTSGHSIRVSILARAIAEDMGLSAAKIDMIEMTALVHDIGKVDAIYASIIRKEGPLSEAERHVILTHAAKGAEFLKTLTSFDNAVIEGVRHHHERFDGSGYPEGLFGERIPLAARIIQLCDSIDAMLSDRPYRKALSIDHVSGELLRCAGTQFDPRIVDIILKKNTLERAAALVRPDRAQKPQLVIASA